MKKLLNNKFNWKLALPAILILSVFMTFIQIFVQVSDPAVAAGYFKVPLLFFLNMLPVLLCMAFLYFATNNICVSYSVTAAVLFALLTVNHYKIYFRDDPLNPNDMLLYKEVGNIVQNYQLTLSWRIVIAAIIFIVLAVLAGFFLRTVKEKWYVRCAGLVCVIALGAVSLKFLYHNNELYDSFNLNENYYREVSVNNSRGLIYNFLYKTTGVYYKKPDGYTPKKAEKYLEGYGKEYTDDQKLPNIIAIMSEAFFDPTVCKNLQYYDGMDPMTEYNKLKPESLYGTLIVPGFAGGTSSTEFEFLSGDNLSLLDKSLPTVYKTHITKKMYGLPYALNELGYRSIAIHPGDKWFYNRENVYKRMGFEEFTTKEDLPQDVEKVHWYVSDNVTGDLVIDKYKQHLKEHPGQNYFNFTVTIQNHGPYESEYIERSPRIKPMDSMPDDMYNLVNNYLNGVADTVNLLKRVTDYAKSLDEPTVVVFFGDHLPFFDNDFVTYEKAGYDLTGDTIEDLVKKHSVPFIIWGNDSAKELVSDSGAKVMQGDYGPVSANFLSVLLMKYINMKMPPFFDYVNSIFNEVHVVAPTYFYNGKEYSQFCKGRQLEALKGYKYLQYYNMRNY